MAPSSRKLYPTGNRMTRRQLPRQGWSLAALLVTFLWVGLSGTAFAEGANPQRKAIEKDQWKKLASFYTDGRSFRVGFEQKKKMVDLGIELKSSGFLKVTPPSGLQWQVLKPSKLLFELKGKKATIQTDGKTQEVPVDARGPNDGLMGLLAWIRMDADLLFGQYKVFQTAPNQYEFQPVEKAKHPFEKLLITLAPAGHVSRIEFNDLAGDMMDIQFEVPKREGR